MRNFACLCLTAVSLTLTAHSARAAVSFQGLGDVAGGSFFSNALAISGDGTTVVGQSSGGANTAFVWTAATGIKALFSTNIVSIAYKTTATGQLVAGEDDSNGAQAVRYQVSPAVRTFLGGLNPGGSPPNQGRTWSISSDASVLVGSVASPASTSGEQAFRYTSGGGLVGIGFLGSINGNGSSFLSEAHDVSGDGSVIVGFSSSNAGQSAFRYTLAGGMQDLGRFTGDTLNYKANAISTNGSVIVGRAVGGQAFTYTVAGGIQVLAGQGAGATNPLDTNLDGSTIVGSDKAPVDLNSSAVFWRNGVEFDLRNFLLAQGNATVNLWSLRTATGISDDGTMITGTGIDPAGNTEAFIANIGAVPEPATWATLLAGLVLLAGMSRVRRTSDG